MLVGELRNHAVAKRHDMQSGCPSSSLCPMNFPHLKENIINANTSSTRNQKARDCLDSPFSNTHIGIHSEYQGQSQGRAVFGGNLKGRALKEAMPSLQSPLLHKSFRENLVPKCENSSSKCVIPGKEEAAMRFDIFTEIRLPHDRRTPCRPSAVTRSPNRWINVLSVGKFLYTMTMTIHLGYLHFRKPSYLFHFTNKNITIWVNCNNSLTRIKAI